LTEEKIVAAEGDFENSFVLSKKEKYILRWAELETKNESKNDEKCWKELKTYYNLRN